MNGHTVQRFGLIAWRTFALLVLLAGLGFTVVAAIGWLQTAHWKPLTVGEGLSSLPAVREWIAHPKSWIGLHRIVSRVLRVPIYLLITLVGVGLTVVSAPERPKQIWQPWSER